MSQCCNESIMCQTSKSTAKNMSIKEHRPTNILVTGGCGFIGSNFLTYVFENNHEIRLICNIDNLSAGNVEKIDDNVRNAEIYEFHNVDLNNKEYIEKLIIDKRIDTVYHFAAQSSVTIGYNNVSQTIKDNILGTINLLEACRHCATLRRFVMISTDEVYGETDHLPEDSIGLNETFCPRPNNHYAASKASAEMFCWSYLTTYGLPIVAVRMSNVYGPKQGYMNMIPIFITKAVNNKPFTVHSDGLLRRFYLHAMDACFGILLVSQKGRLGEVYNISGSVEYTVVDSAKLILTIVDDLLKRPRSKFVVEYITGRPKNDRRYLMDGTKIENELDWHEQISFEDGFYKTIKWYLDAMRRTGLECPLDVSRHFRLLIYGHRGWLGQQFVEIARENKDVEIILGSHRVGEDDDAEIENEIITSKATHVVSFIGRTFGPGVNNIDYLEGGPDRTYLNVRDNLYGPWLLAELTRKHNLHFTYIGSGCLFTYDDAHPPETANFKEEDRPNYFGSSYSVIKGFTDRIMHYYQHVLNIRMRMPVSTDKSPRNLISKLLMYKKIVDYPNSVTVMPNMLPILLRLLKKKEVGTINFVQPGALTNSQILELYGTHGDAKSQLNYEVLNNTPNDPLFDKLLKSRSFCRLDSQKIQSLAPDVQEATEALKCCFAAMKSEHKKLENQQFVQCSSGKTSSCSTSGIK